MKNDEQRLPFDEVKAFSMAQPCADFVLKQIVKFQSVR